MLRSFLVPAWDGEPCDSVILGWEWSYVESLWLLHKKNRIYPYRYVCPMQTHVNPKFISVGKIWLNNALWRPE